MAANDREMEIGAGAGPGDPLFPTSPTRQADIRLLVTICIVALCTLSFIMFVLPVGELAFVDQPSRRSVFDALIAAGSVGWQGKGLLILAHTVPLLLSFLISEKLDRVIWWFVAVTSLLSAVGAAILISSMGTATDACQPDSAKLYCADLGTFRSVSADLTPIQEAGHRAAEAAQSEAELDTAIADVEKAVTKVKNGYFSGLGDALLFGMLFNLFVLISLIKNAVAADFLKNVLGIGI